MGAISAFTDGLLGKTSQAAWQAALGIVGIEVPLPIDQGGTGATSVADALAVLGLSGLTFTDWASYAPTITSGTGTFTTVSGTGRWMQVGKLVVAEISVTDTTNGTAAGSVIVTLPVTASGSILAFSGRENALTGKGLTGFLSAGNLAIFADDDTFPMGTGSTLSGFVFYEAA